MNSVKMVIISVLSVILFNVISFAIPFLKNITFMIAYLFGMVAIITVIIVGFLTNSSKKDLVSRVYGWPILYVASVYATIQILLSILFMTLSGIIATWIVAIISIILFILCLIGILGLSVSNSKLQSIDIHVQSKRDYIASLENTVKLASSCCEDAALSKQLNKLVEKIHYSDPMSSENLNVLEDEIMQKSNNLKLLVDENETEEAIKTCKEITLLLEERNQKCLLMKK